jgi:hypothetical protein
VAVQEREAAESRAAAERTQRWEAVLRNQLSQERDRNEKLRAELAGLREQHQHLQEQHRQSQLAASESEQQIAALKTELAQQRETVARLTRESLTPPVTACRVHVDQTPRPMAPYGYWASPSGYRYGGTVVSGGSWHQRFGLRQTVRGLEQLRQVVEVAGHVRVFRPVGLLVDLQRPPQQRFGPYPFGNVLPALANLVEQPRRAGASCRPTRLPGRPAVPTPTALPPTAWWLERGIAGFHELLYRLLARGEFLSGHPAAQQILDQAMHTDDPRIGFQAVRTAEQGQPQEPG